ncbi:MAG TPA: DNA alkylation repair protein, partial [Candidatus Limnocylindrales bacterium]|nr:DNA alkylation repair protein [Candidatus Limnocylindrales bacterium]
MSPATGPGVATMRARALVAARKDLAVSLGRRAGDFINEPANLVDMLRAGLEELADPDYLAGQRMIAPGIGPQLGVRQPLLAAVSRGLRSATRRDRPTTVLDVAVTMLRDPLAELHWLAIDLLDRTITREPEQTWQLVRAESRRA